MTRQPQQQFDKTGAGVHPELAIDMLDLGVGSPFVDQPDQFAKSSQVRIAVIYKVIWHTAFG